jgi:hypothetical protein
MEVRIPRLAVVLFALGTGLALQSSSWGQASPGQQPPNASGDVLPPVPAGLEVQTRGPVHEAFATPTAEPAPTQLVPKQPPKPLDEMPPEEKPEGDVTWIGGYWAFDDERKDFLWVSGTWRTPPPGKRWVAGYWREEGGQWQWVPGFWSKSENEQTIAQNVTYMPAPPQAPAVAPPGEAPAPDAFYVPGSWAWHNAGYVTVNGTQTWQDAGYAWTAGYWARVQPGYVWVAAHYRWTPSGYIYIPGYWDLAISRRGMLYAPVVVDVAVVGPGFVYTPVYAVPEAVVVDAMFIRPAYCHYYFGDYYGPGYHSMGFEACIVYSRSHYDAVFVYERWDHRADPRWESVQIDICFGRSAGRVPCPPRTFVQQNTIIQNNITNVRNVTNVTNVNNVNVNNVNNVTKVNNYSSPMVMPASKVAAAQGTRTVPLDTSARLQSRQQAQAIQQVAMQRGQTEVASPGGAPKQPRAATLHVPSTQPATVRAAASTNVHQTAANMPANGPGANTNGTSPTAPGANGKAPVKPGQPPGQHPMNALLKRPPLKTPPKPPPKDHKSDQGGK